MVSPMALALASVALVGADVVDRVAAVVGGQVITRSDVRAARALGLVAVDPSAPDSAILDRLVVRELMRTEVDRYSVAATDAASVETRARAARERLGTAGPRPGPGPDPLDALGMTAPRLRAWIEDDARIERYLQQRFDAAAQPTDDEVLTFFQSREREFTREGQPQSFEVVRDAARARLVGQRRQQLIDEWVASLRRRTTIVLPP